MSDKSETTMPDGYEGAITLAWKGDRPEGTDGAVVADIRVSLWGLERPSELCFHHVFLTEDDGGPSVFVWGVADSPDFHCEYLPVTVWGEAEANAQL